MALRATALRGKLRKGIVRLLLETLWRLTEKHLCGQPGGQMQIWSIDWVLRIWLSVLRMGLYFIIKCQSVEV